MWAFFKKNFQVQGSCWALLPWLGRIMAKPLGLCVLWFYLRKCPGSSFSCATAIGLHRASWGPVPYGVIKSSKGSSSLFNNIGFFFGGGIPLKYHYSFWCIWYAGIMLTQIERRKDGGRQLPGYWRLLSVPSETLLSVNPAAEPWQRT